MKFPFLERIHVQNFYGDMERGIFIIRGENVVLLGEIVSSIKLLEEHSFYYHSFYRIARKKNC